MIWIYQSRPYFRLCSFVLGWWFSILWSVWYEKYEWKFEKLALVFLCRWSFPTITAVQSITDEDCFPQFAKLFQRTISNTLTEECSMLSFIHIIINYYYQYYYRLLLSVLLPFLLLRQPTTTVISPPMFKLFILCSHHRQQ